MNNFNKIIVFLGIIAIIGILWVVFAPVNDISNQMHSMYTENVTDNITPVMTDNGTISVYNDFQEGFAKSLWLIIVAGIVVFGIIIVASSSNTGV